MRLVLDTCVVVSALRSDRGASRWILSAALERRFTMLLSVPLLLEYEAVLSRREQRDELRWALADVGVFLDGLASVVEPVAFSFLWRPCLRDANDEMVLETAVNGGANTLVTHNLGDFAPCRSRFGIPVARPREAMQTLKRPRAKIQEDQR